MRGAILTCMSPNMKENTNTMNLNKSSVKKNPQIINII